MLLERRRESQQAIETGLEQQSDRQQLNDLLQSDRFANFQNQAVRRTTEQSVQIKLITQKFKPLVHCPEKSVMTKEYNSKFKERVSEKVRLEKRKNKRSRLYQKNLNREMIMNAERSLLDEGYERLKEAGYDEKILMENEDLNDLAAFMTEDKAANAELSKLLVGEKESKEGMNAREAMDRMYKTIMSANISNIRLENDKELSKNAAKLEKLTMQVMAFDRLSRQNGYFNSFSDAEKEVMQDKLEQVRSVVNYYSIRKDIITDELYSSHYNDELSMDVTNANTNEEQALAEKLLKAYAAGRYMMEKNGVSEKKIRALGEPKFKDIQQGKQALRVHEEQLKSGKTATLLKENYKQSGQVLADKAVENLKNYEGEIELQPGYKEEAYDAQKVKAYLEELKQIDVNSLKCRSYLHMINNYSFNYKLCSRVEFLQHQIVRGLMHGFKDPSFNDAAMVEFRAKTNFFVSFRRTMCVVNNKIACGLKGEYSNKDDKWWETTLKENMNIKDAYVYHIFTPGNAELTYKKYKKSAKEENDSKDEAISTTYKLLFSENQEEIPKEELKKRRAEYNKNAIIQDYMCQNITMPNRDPSTGYFHYLRAKARKEGKRAPAEEDRNFVHFIQGKSAKEIERLFNLAIGTNEQRLEYYKEQVSTIFSYDINKYDTNDLGSFADDWHKKYQVADITSDNLRNTYTFIKNIIEKSEGKLTLPKEFKTMEEMITKCRAMYDFGCGIMSGRVLGLTQISSNKYAHAISIEDLASFDTKKLFDLEARMSELDDYITEEFTNKKVPKWLDESFKALRQYVGRLRGFIFPENKTKGMNEDGEYDVFELNADVQKVYNEIYEHTLKNPQVENNQQ